MKILKTLVAVLAMSISTTAFAAGETPDGTLSSEEAMKMEIFNRVENLDIQNYALEDCTVEVTYNVDAAGQVHVVATAGASCLANEYIKLKMEGRKLYVAEHLQGKDQTVKLRYVVI